MAGNNPRPSWEARLSDAAARVEAELRHLTETIDREVVPEVRRHSSTALRTLATKLDSLAQHLDDARKPAPPADPEGKP